MTNFHYYGYEENESWIDHWKYPNHEFSTAGRIRHKKSKHILKPHIDRYGYCVLSIGSVDNVFVHRAICEAFYGPAPFENAQVNHIDCDRQNNHILNLEWCTPRDNIMWSVRKGRINYQNGLDKAKEANLTPVRIIELDMIFNSVKECAEFLNIYPNRVSRCLTGSRKGQRLHGYHIEYA